MARWNRHIAIAVGSNHTRDVRNARRLVLVGGGTAGHVYPALAIANAYQQVVASLDKVHEETGFGGERVTLWKIDWRHVEAFD